jgi:hypothetical protein
VSRSCFISDHPSAIQRLVEFRSDGHQGADLLQLPDLQRQPGLLFRFELVEFREVE